MPTSLPNQPRILRGAFVEYGLSVPPLVVPFQFNPLQLARSRSLSFNSPEGAKYAREKQKAAGKNQQQKDNDEAPERSLRGHSLRDMHQKKEYVDLQKLREDQLVDIQEESLSFEIRLDATDALNEGNPITEQFGIAPQLAALELLTLPKSESLTGWLLDKAGFSFTKIDKPPITLFIWGRKRILPVNITSMSITESEFSTDLNPIRATVSVSLTVIEGLNPPYLYSKTMQEAMAALNLANLASTTAVVDVVLPL